MNKIFRAKRTRAKINGTAERPRLTVSFSNLHIVAQIIDDTKDDWHENRKSSFDWR